MAASEPGKPKLKLVESKSLAELVGQKHHTVLDPADPVFLVATVLTELQDKARDEIAKLIAEAAAAMAASTAQADAAAHARAERIITESGRWSSEQIRSAAQDGATAIAAKLEPLIARAEAASKRSVVFGWIAAVAALAALGSAGVVVWLA
jgi:hypothetical protein